MREPGDPDGFILETPGRRAMGWSSWMEKSCRNDSPVKKRFESTNVIVALFLR